MQAGFSQVDITPQLPIRKYGGLHKTVYARTALDPIFVSAAVFESGGARLAVISLDIVIIEWEHVKEIRERVEAACGIPGDHVLVCATHNHACPAVITRPVFDREEEYLALMRDRAVEAVTKACGNMAEVSVGSGSGFEGRVSFNRRYIMKDGTVKTHPRPGNPDMRCPEGVIDPEVGVVCAKRPDGTVAGVLVNFSCHAVHFIGPEVLSAGYPGALRRHIKATFGPDCGCVFLNGACANIHHANPLDPGYVDDPNRMGALLAEDTARVVQGMAFEDELELAGCGTQIELALRDPEPLADAMRQPGFTDPLLAPLSVYEASLQILRGKMAAGGHETAFVQALRIGDAVLAAIPAEYFVEHGLRIKMESDRKRTFVVSLANGWVGYVPTVEAFARKGGHETTSALWSKLVPEAGDTLADTALSLIRQL